MSTTAPTADYYVVCNVLPPPTLLLPPIPNISKVWTKCGVTHAYQTLFPNVFFYWFYRALAQSAEPVSFSSHIKKVRSTPAQVARLHPNFGAPVKRVPICWRDMSGAESASVGQKRKNFNLSDGEELGTASKGMHSTCLLYTSPSPRDKRQSRMPSSA